MLSRRIAAGALALGGLLVIGASLGLWFLSTPSVPQVHAGLPVLVTDASDPAAVIAAHNTPAVTVDPADPRHLVLAERVDRPRFGCAVQYSLDGGLTWSQSVVSLPAGFDTCYMPDVTFAGSAVLVVYLTLNTHPRDPLSGGNDPNGTWLARSTDGGRSFALPTDLNGHDNLQPRIVSDATGNRVYVVYLRGNHLQNDTPLGLGPTPNPILVMTSVDGGVTFSTPTQVSDPGRLRVGAPTPVVGPGGRLLVLYEDYGNDLDDYHNKATPFTGTHTLVLATSTDHGATFHQDVVDSLQVRPHRFLIYLPAFPALAVTPDGKMILAAWSDARQGAPDILLRRSSDGGRSWSRPLRLNRRSAEPANYELPALSATAARIDAIFVALSGTPARGQIEYTYSVDHAATFSVPAPISNSFDARVGVPNARDLGHIDLGSRLALVPLGSTGLALAVWSDASKGNRNTGRTDIFASRIRP